MKQCSRDYRILSDEYISTDMKLTLDEVLDYLEAIIAFQVHSKICKDLLSLEINIEKANLTQVPADCLLSKLNYELMRNLKPCCIECLKIKNGFVLMTIDFSTIWVFKQIN